MDTAGGGECKSGGLWFLWESDIDRSLVIARNEDIFFHPMSPIGEEVLTWITGLHRRRQVKWTRETVAPTQKIDSEGDLWYLRALDPLDWKEQDHYQVLGLRHLRVRATEEDIKKAYKVRVLRHHPDKRQAAGETVNREGDYFASIVKAYEVLSNLQRRRAYDSVDPEFDDFLLTSKCLKPSQDFFAVFGKWFALNARWSTVQPVPLLGNSFSTRTQVEHFYNFWFDFDSWREYSYLDEESKETGSSREERRWIEKQNKTQRAKLKKEEMGRIRSVVEASHNLDPRVALYKELDKRQKLEKKLARRRLAQESREELNKARIEEEQKAREEMERRQAEEREKEAAIKKAKDAQRKALKRERKGFRTLCKEKNYFVPETDEKAMVANMASVEELCEVLRVEELARINESWSNLNAEEARQEFESAVANARKRIEMEKVKTSEVWTSRDGNDEGQSNETSWDHDELQTLTKAVNMFPAGTSQRWQVVANFVNQQNCQRRRKDRTAKEVLAKTKDLMTSAHFSQNSFLKEEVNEKAFELFEKAKKNQNVNAEAVEQEKSIRDEVGASRKVNREAGPSSRESSAVSKSWSAAEQKLLEQALKTFPASCEDRWGKIAECVPGRSKSEVVARFKELAALVKAKKCAQNVK